MNDDELITLVRAQRDKIPLATPVEEIISRGRAVRARRLVPAAAVLAAAAAAAVGVTALAPASQQASRPHAARLAAWTVTELADGNISVTVRQLRDPAGLERRLRADGVPASVTFKHLNPSCMVYPGGAPGSPGQPPSPLLKRVFPEPYRSLPQLPPGQTSTHFPPGHPPTIVIDPSALPGHTGVQLAASFAPRSVNILLPQVVHTSSQCTGS